MVPTLQNKSWYQITEINTTQSEEKWSRQNMCVFSHITKVTYELRLILAYVRIKWSCSNFTFIRLQYCLRSILDRMAFNFHLQGEYRNKPLAALHACVLGCHKNLPPHHMWANDLSCPNILLSLYSMNHLLICSSSIQCKPVLKQLI
jgi:hypothetical protein